MDHITIEEVGLRVAEALTREGGREPVFIMDGPETIALLIRIPRGLVQEGHPWPVVVLCGPLAEDVYAGSGPIEPGIHDQAQAGPLPVYGSCKGMLKVLVEDDEHLKDFEEYMQ
jgi:hypothetical protein